MGFFLGLGDIGGLWATILPRDEAVGSMKLLLKLATGSGAGLTGSSSKTVVGDETGHDIGVAFSGDGVAVAVLAREKGEILDPIDERRGASSTIGLSGDWMELAEDIRALDSSMIFFNFSFFVIFTPI